jgi:hypothetical protein
MTTQRAVLRLLWRSGRSPTPGGRVAELLQRTGGLTLRRGVPKPIRWRFVESAPGTESCLQSAANSISTNARTRGVAGWLVLYTLVVLQPACRGSTDPVQQSVWTTLAASESYTCGLSPAAEALCWGWVPGYYYGPPPEDSLMPKSAVPLRVPGERRFVDITVGALSVCGLDGERRAYCWGANQLGEVGDSSYVAKRSPSAVAGDLRWRMISMGGAHACGVTLENQAYCWGNQFRGALGNGELAGATPYPVAVLGGLSFAAVYAGLGTSCGITVEGEAYCWGINDYGMLGDSQPPEPGPEIATPSRVVGGLRFTALALGEDHACGIAQDARGYCWGSNATGQLGVESTQSTSSPMLVTGDLRWTSISVGYAHSCGLTTDGSAYCWGNNERGQFGTGDTGKSYAPVVIAGPGTYVAVTAGGNHTCGLTDTGTAFCWGQGNYGQLGDGIFADRLRPVQVAAYP